MNIGFRKTQFRYKERMFCNGQCLWPIKGLDGEAVSKIGTKLLKVIRSYWVNQWMVF